MFQGSLALNCYIAVNKLLLSFSIFSTATKHRKDFFSAGFLEHGSFSPLVLHLCGPLPRPSSILARWWVSNLSFVDKKLLFFSFKISSYTIYQIQKGNANSQGLKYLNSSISMQGPNLTKWLHNSQSKSMPCHVAFTQKYFRFFFATCEHILAKYFKL